MRKVAIYATIILAIIGAGAILPSVPVIREAILTQLTAAIPDITLEYEESHGNAWSGITLHNAYITHPKFGALDIETLSVSYYLPAILGGQLPLTVAASGVIGDVMINDIGASSPASVRPRVTPLLRDVALDGIDITVNGVPFALSDLTLDDVQVAQTSARTLEVTGIVGSDFGAVHARADIDLVTGEISGDITDADLGFVQTWWPPLISGHGRGSFSIGNGDIEAMLYVSDAALDLLDLGLDGVDGVVHFTYPVLEFDVTTNVLAGSAAVVGTVDFGASHYQIDGDALAPLGALADWIGRASAPNGLPIDLGGDADVQLSISGWNTARVDAEGSALGAFLGSPLILEDVLFSYFENGQMRLDANATYTGKPLEVTMRPASDGTHLRVTAETLSLFLPDDTEFSLFSNVHTGYVNAHAHVTLQTAGDPLRILAELDGVPNEYSFYTDATLGADRIGTGAFAVDGRGDVSGQIGVSLPLPGNDPLTATGTLRGTLSEADITLETESPRRIMLPVAGTVIEALDPRGSLAATFTTAGFTDIHGVLGGLTLANGVFTFATQSGVIDVSGAFSPIIANFELPITVHDMLVGYSSEVTAAGSLGVAFPVLPSAEQLAVDISTTGDITVTSADDTIQLRYDEHGLRLDAVHVPVALGDTTLPLTAHIREVNEVYLIEAIIPAGTAFGGVALRHETTLHGTFDPATQTDLHLAGASGGTPVLLETDGVAVLITLQDGDDALTISVQPGEPIALRGSANLAMVEEVLCFGDCASRLNLAGTFTSDAAIDIATWHYRGSLNVDLAGTPITIHANADEHGTLHADVLLDGASEPLLTVRLPANTPSMAALSEVFSGGFADMTFAGVHLPRIPWDVQVDLAAGSGRIELPNGEFRVATIDGVLVATGQADIPLEAGEIPLILHVALDQTALTNLADARVTATLYTEDGTALITAQGTPSELRGDAALAIDDLAALLGQDALVGLTVDGQQRVKGEIVVNALVGDIDFSATVGNISANGSIQNGMPTFTVATDGSEIALPGIPPIVLKGTLTPDAPLDATAHWETNGASVTATLDYLDTVITAKIPAEQLRIAALPDVMGEITASYDLAAGTLETDGAYTVAIGDDIATLHVTTPARNPQNLQAIATYGEYEALWTIDHPAQLRVTGPDIDTTAFLETPITATGTAFGYDVALSLDLSDGIAGSLTSSALPGEITVTFDSVTNVIHAELSGETPVTAELRFENEGLAGTIDALGQQAHVGYHAADNAVRITHELFTAEIDITTLAWHATIAYEHEQIALNATATGIALEGTIAGTAAAAGMQATIDGTLADGIVTLTARGEEIAGTRLLATVVHHVGTPLDRAVVNMQLTGAAHGGGSIRFDDNVPVLRATLLSDILPGARAVIRGELRDGIVVSASGEGALAGRVLFQDGVLSGSLQLTHDVGTVDAFIIDEEAHVTARTPYLPGGSLFTIVPLDHIPSRIALDGLGTIVGEVIVDLNAQHIELANVSAHHDVGTLRVDQTIRFAGPYTVAGEVQISPLERPIPVAAELRDEGLRISITGATGEAFTVIPTDIGPIAHLKVELRDFALPLAGAEALPLTGEAVLGFQGGISLAIMNATTGDVALVGADGFVPDLSFHVNASGDVVATTVDYTFTITVTDTHISVREEQTGGGIDIALATEAGITTVDVTTHDNVAFLAATGLPLTAADIHAQVVLGDERIHGYVDVTNIALDGIPATVPYLRVGLPETSLAAVLDAAFELSGAIHVAGAEALELIGNAFFEDGIPTIDLISSSGQQLSGTIFPLDIHVTSIGALQGTAHLTQRGARIDELYLELDQARVLIDGDVTFATLPAVSLLGQIAYRDELNEYPASFFSLTGENGTYDFTLGEVDHGVTAEIALTDAWDPTVRVTITDFVMQLPAFENTLLNGDILVSGGSITGSSTIRIGNGSITARGSVPFTDFTNLLSGTSAANAEITVHQVGLHDIPFLGLPTALSGAINGTVFLRGGTVSGQFIVPSLFSKESGDYVDIYIYGSRGSIEATTSMYGSVLSLNLTDEVLSGSLQLEQFPVHEVVKVLTTSDVPDVYATGFARVEVPLERPQELYARIATEAVNVMNDAGEPGTIDISAVYEHERLEVHTFDVTGIGTWHASGVLSSDVLDFSLAADDAALGAILRLIPALRTLQPELSGSFEATATGSVTEPQIRFNASQLIAGIAGSRYELHDTKLTVDQSGIDIGATIVGGDALEGSLVVSGTGAVGTSLFDVLDMELTVNGNLAVPTVGLIDDISGTITIPANAAPTVDITGYLGNQLALSGTLDPLDITIRGSDIRLSLPVLMVQDTRLHPDLRLFVGSQGLSLGGELRADFLTLDPGLRAKQLQVAEETGTSNPLTGLHLAGVRVVVPQRLSFVNSLATIEGAADIVATGPLAKLELEGSASAIRGVIRFSGRDFELIETAVTFSRTAGIYPHIRILARTRIEKSRITSGRDDIAFVQPVDGQTFDIDLLISGDVTPAPLEPGGFTFDVSPVLSSNAVLEITSDTAGRTTHTFSNDELLTLAVLGRLDLSSSVAGSGSFGSAIAQGVIDSALDVLIVSEIERALKAELGFDLLELRTSSLSALATQGAEPFGVSLKVGGYLDDGLFATYQISTLDRGQYGPVLMNQVGLQYDVGPVVFDVAARIYSPNDVTLFETVPELGVSVRYDVTEKLNATGAFDLSADRFAVRFGVNLVW